MKNLLLLTMLLLGVFQQINAQSLSGTGSSVYLLNQSNSVSPIFLGIGTKDPTHKLMIEGNEDGNNREFIRLHNTNTGFNSAVGIRITASDDNEKYAAISFAGKTYGNGTDVDQAFNLYTNGKSLNLFTGGVMKFRVNPLGTNSEVMRISEAGNIGINTISPTAKLHTKGTVRMQELPEGSSLILTINSEGNLNKSSTSLTDLNAKITDLVTRLAIAEEEIKTLKKKVGFNTPTNERVQLFQNEPNPVNTNTKIKFYLPEQVNKANVFVMDINGKMLQTFELNNVMGHQEITIDANTFDAGMYFYTLLLEGKEVDTKKMFIIK